MTGEPVYRGILGVDIERYGRAEWTDPIRSRLRARLYRLLDDAITDAAIDPALTERSDTGDGLWLLVNAAISTARLIHPLATSLVRGLIESNKQISEPERMRLRIAIHAGDMIADSYGQAGASMIHAGRLLDAKSTRLLLANSPEAPALLVVSDNVYEGIVRHGYEGIETGEWQPIRIDSKETVARAWVRLPGLAARPPLTRSVGVPPMVSPDRAHVPEPRAGIPPDPIAHFVGRHAELEIVVHQTMVELDAEAKSRGWPADLGAGYPPDAMRHFVGREGELTELRRLLHEYRRVAVHGLAGVGKTQLIVRYVNQCNADYSDGVFWLRAEKEISLAGDLANLTWRLRLPEREEREQERQIEAVLRWLRERRSWLLVLDNLEPTVGSTMQSWLPPGLQGHVVVTSRAPMWSSRLRVEPLPLEVAEQFLIERTGQADPLAARAVAEAVGCLPLALGQAAAYLEASGRDLSSYADMLRTRLVELMDEGRPEDYPRTVATTMQLSLQRLERERPAAAALLCLCAFLAPDDIPISALLSNADKLPAALQHALADSVEFDRTITALHQYSLMRRHGDGLNLHRLVQAIVRESLDENEWRAWSTGAIRLLRGAIPERAHAYREHWQLCDRLIPHVEIVEELVEQSVEPHLLAALVNEVACYLMIRGKYSTARPMLERVLAVRERICGPNHGDTAVSLANLAVLLSFQSDLTAARTLDERALAIRERLLGPDHPDVAKSLHNLAFLLQELGEPEPARLLYERALAISEQANGPDDPETAWILVHYAAQLREQGDLAKARPLMERAVYAIEATLGPDHPNTASALHNLGWLLRDQGELDAARPLFVRSLAIAEAVLGPDHPFTARGLDHLGWLLREQGELDAARPLHERALDIRMRVLGPDHNRTGHSLHNLGVLLRQQGELVAAHRLFERALAVKERALGPAHRWTTESRVALHEARDALEQSGRT